MKPGSPSGKRPIVGWTDMEYWVQGTSLSMRYSHVVFPTVWFPFSPTLFQSIRYDVTCSLMLVEVRFHLTKIEDGPVPCACNSTYDEETFCKLSEVPVDDKYY